MALQRYVLVANPDANGDFGIQWQWATYSCSFVKSKTFWRSLKVFIVSVVFVT